MDQLSATFAALADPTRRAILAQLAQGEAPVSRLAEPFAMSLPAISKHLKVLEKAGLITRGRDAQWRPCRIAPDALQGIDEWLARYRHFWGGSLDRLDAYLSDFQDAQGTSPQETGPGQKVSPVSRRCKRSARGK